MKIAALVNSPDHVCARYRINAFRPLLEAAGHTLAHVCWPHSFPMRLALNRTLREADIVVVQRRLFSPWQMFWLKRVARRLWFDFDDAIFLRDSYHPKGPYSARLQRGFARVIAASQFVLAGNRFLAEHAARWTDPSRVQVVPTCVDVARYPTAVHAEKTTVSLTWIGSSSTLQGLELVRTALEQLGQRHAHLRFQVICDRTLSWSHLPVDFCPWSESMEASDLARADIGISWVPDDDWSRGKCGLKVLQYMAAGLPVIANRVGVHPDMIEHGKTGLLVNTPGEFAAAVEKLSRDRGLRAAMGMAGRRRVEERFSLDEGGKCWLRLLDVTRFPSQRSA